MVEYFENLISPKITVIIPTYNPQNYILDCFESLEKQTFSDYEVLVILNGEEHPYEEYLQCKLNSYSFRAKLFYSKVKGVSIARNIGLDKAQGEYIAFIDDDDYVPSNYLSELYKIAKDDAISICNVTAFGDKNSSFFLHDYLQKYSFVYTEDLYKFRSILSVPWAKLIPRKLIGCHRFKVGITNGEDALFVTSCTAGMHRLYCTKATTYFVRMRNGSASRRKIPLGHLCKNTVLLFGQYVKVYFSSPRQYDLKLFMARLPGVIKNFVVLLCQ